MQVELGLVAVSLDIRSAETYSRGRVCFSSLPVVTCHTMTLSYESRQLFQK